MKEYVGVIDPFIITGEETLNVSQLKRHALMFSHLTLPSPPDGVLSLFKSEKSTSAITELEWLLTQGIVRETKLSERFKLTNPEDEKVYEAMIRHSLGVMAVIFGVDLYELRQAKKGLRPKLSEEEIDKLEQSLENLRKLKPEDLFNVVESENLFNHTYGMSREQTRLFSIILRQNSGLDAYPILATPIPTQESPATKSEVVQIVLEALPIPDDSTPWEQIIEFRSDPDSYNKYVDLRNWMSEVARAALPPTEVGEKLEYLLRQYQRHMEVHKMKTNMGTLETILVTTGEVIENLATLKIGQAAKTLFAVKQRKIALLEGELTAPGNEVAYIAKAQDTF
jgi:hypothetical protein